MKSVFSLISDYDIKRKEKYRPESHEHICRNPQQHTSKSNPSVYKNESIS